MRTVLHCPRFVYSRPAPYPAFRITFKITFLPYNICASLLLHIFNLALKKLTLLLTETFNRSGGSGRQITPLLLMNFFTSSFNTIEFSPRAVMDTENTSAVIADAHSIE
jgi:hypothetical protein